MRTTSSEKSTLFSEESRMSYCQRHTRPTYSCKLIGSLSHRLRSVEKATILQCGSNLVNPHGFQGPGTVRTVRGTSRSRPSWRRLWRSCRLARICLMTRSTSFSRRVSPDRRSILRSHDSFNTFEPRWDRHVSELHDEKNAQTYSLIFVSRLTHVSRSRKARRETQVAFQL